MMQRSGCVKQRLDRVALWQLLHVQQRYVWPQEWCCTRLLCSIKLPGMACPAVAGGGQQLDFTKTVMRHQCHTALARCSVVLQSIIVPYGRGGRVIVTGSTCRFDGCCLFQGVPYDKLWCLLVVVQDSVNAVYSVVGCGCCLGMLALPRRAL
jgi:hypothetical protein